MTIKECLYLDKLDIPTELYEDLYHLASFKGDFCESFFVRLSYIDNYVEDLSCAGAKDVYSDYSNKLSFYKKLSKEIHDFGYDLLFVCNDDDLRMEQ